MNKGTKFEKQVKGLLKPKLGDDFKPTSVYIGNPGKKHCFDLISEKRKIIIECKCYSWRENVQIPCAKISTLNEAIFFMQNITPTDDAPNYENYLKVIVLKKAYNPSEKKTLAQYFNEKYGCLTQDIEIVEIDDSNKIEFIKGERFKNIMNNNFENCNI